MVMLGRKFRSPKTSDIAQWKKVQALVERGFYFQSVYRATPEGGKRAVPYPRTLREVTVFAQEFVEQAAPVVNEAASSSAVDAKWAR
jgi:hypothetical protein